LFYHKDDNPEKVLEKKLHKMSWKH